MEIAIIGCSHSLNTGVNLYQTVTDINDGKFDETANNGYGAILAKMFPQHNFTLFPAVGGGNKEILELLTFAIEQKKYEMYIVQTTSWHRFVAGLLYYNKNNIIQKEINPDKIVIIKFLDSIPIKKAINIAITFGSLNSFRIPSWFIKTAGNIIAGKTADGTYVKIFLTL